MFSWRASNWERVPRQVMPIIKVRISKSGAAVVILISALFLDKSEKALFRENDSECIKEEPL